MANLLGNLSGRQRLFLFTLIVSLSSILLTIWKTDNLLQTLIIAITCIFIFLIAKSIWLPEGYGKTGVRLASLAILSAVTLAYPWWAIWLVQYFNSRQDFPEAFRNLPMPDVTPSAGIMVFILIGIFIVNFFNRDTTVMVCHSDPKGIALVDQDFSRKLMGLKSILKADLDKIDRETRWSEEYFEPLDAEVEIRKNGRTTRRIMKLLPAIRRDRFSKVFLILGDPGSGKSVALRKLANQLLEEISETGKVPIYVNLREWKTEKEWTEENSPTVKQLEAFLLETLKRRGDVFIENFLCQKVGEQTMFSQMLEDGRFFLILDFFDEIPQVLDENEASWLIDELSSVIYRFLAGGNQSRGLLASRMFRRPSANFDARTVLEIRPFTEDQILSSLKNRSLYSEVLRKKIFADRPDLVPALRNPFTTGLIPLFAEHCPDRLPDSQSELYQNYLNQRLSSCQGLLDRLNKSRSIPLTQDNIIQGAQKIAWTLFQKFGLEASSEELIDCLVQEYDYAPKDVRDIMKILCYGRIARQGSSIDENFSFVHRRFAEYFVAQCLPNEFEKLPLDSIPKDERWREALVLYCDITDEVTARKIAWYCWEYIRGMENYSQDMGNPKYLESIHCLRFLNFAYRNRLNLINSFQEDLGKTICSIITSCPNLLFVKISVEAIGLLNTNHLGSAIIAAFAFGNNWISETALRSCRHLSIQSRESLRMIEFYLDSIDSLELLRREKEILFSLSLSDSLKSLAFSIKFRLLDIKIALVNLTCTFFVLFHFNNHLKLELIEDNGMDSLLFLTFTSYWLGLISRLSSSRRIRLFDSDYHTGFISIYFFEIMLTLALFMTFNPYESYYFVFMQAHEINDFLLLLPTTVFLIVFFLSTIPFLYIYDVIKDDVLTFSRILKRAKYLLKTFLMGILALATLLTFGVFVKYLLDLDIKLLNQLLMLSAQIIFWGFLIYALRITKTPLMLFFLEIFSGIKKSILSRKESYSDRSKIRTIKKDMSNLKWTRALVLNKLKYLKTSSARCIFLEDLLEHKIKPTGSWPNNQYPVFKNKEVDTLLAQLEERWLGLDR